MRRLAVSGIDGIYFSSKWINKLPPARYRELAAPHDLRIISEAKSLWCNMFHLCEGGIDLSAVADYPVQVFHWDANAERNPGYDAGLERVPHAAVGGGVDARALAFGTPEDVERKARAWIERTNGSRFILGPGCSIITAKTPAANLRALKDATVAMA